MPAQIHDRNELIAMLAWQLDMGVDEVLLDHPVPDVPPLRLEQLLAENDGTSASMAVTPAIRGAASQQDIIRSSLMLSGDAAPDTMSFDHQPVRANTGADLAAVSSITSLAELQAGLAGLDACPLKHTASNLCFADGNPGARLMIIGEAPGRDEDRMGVPFVGADGQLLDKMLMTIGVDRASAYLTNLLPWRPPGNRSATDEETAMLLPWLSRHVQLAKPDIVLLLGGAAAKLILGSNDGIMKLRGQWHEIDFGDGVLRPALASLHPAYLLRSPAQKRLAFEDLLRLAKRLTANGKKGALGE
ncbi:MAG: uracil-DNA glycosylase [Candidatus Puniceispirillum sp.]|nr:uracil-DNA glycosylase [Candidatus Puniceispirillum sp.]